MADKNFVPGNKYVITNPIKVCTENPETKDCEFADMVDLPANTEYVFIDLDEGKDLAHNKAYRFKNGDGTIYRLHDNDIVSILLP